MPVWAFPETAESLFHHAASGLGLERTTLDLSLPWLSAPLLLGFGVALSGYVLNAVQAAPNATLLVIDILELLLLTAFFMLVPAYLAIGVYFAFWHSIRHLARLHTINSGNAKRVAAGRLLRSVGQLTLDLLPLTLAALTLLGGLYLFSAARVVTLEGFVALYLVLVSSLTLPHAVVVAMLDVWEPAAA